MTETQTDAPQVHLFMGVNPDVDHSIPRDVFRDRIESILRLVGMMKNTVAVDDIETPCFVR